MRTLLLSALCATLLSGCGEDMQQKKPAAATIGSNSAKTGVITFYRPSAFYGWALNTSVHVDGTLIADLDNGTYVSVKASAGNHAIYSDEADDSFSINVEPGRTRYVRVDLVPGAFKGHGKLTLLEPEQGSGEFASKKLKLAEDIREPSVVIRTK